MPKLWVETIEAHRREVGDAILDTAAGLAAEHGLRAVTMSQIAEETGIGRATLYKYFPDVESILLAWHERQITRHLDQLAQVRDRMGSSIERLEAVLETYALMSRGSRSYHDSELAVVLHRGEHVVRAELRLRDLIRDLVVQAVSAGDVRDDVPPEELATYCLRALTATGDLPTKAAAHRLVEVVMTGLRPPT